MKKLILNLLFFTAPISAMESNQDALTPHQQFQKAIQDRVCNPRNFKAYFAARKLIDQVDPNAVIDSLDESALFLMIKNTDVAMVHLLIRHNVDINQRSNFTQLTPLMETVGTLKGRIRFESYIWGDESALIARMKIIAQLLIQAGADIDQKREGKTAIDMAEEWALNDFANFLRAQSEEYARSGKIDIKWSTILAKNKS